MKKIVVFLLVLCCLCCVAFAAEAKTADLAAAKWTDGTETFEGTLAECMAKVNEFGGTLTLLDDVTGPGEFPTTRNDIDDADYIIGSKKAFTLDLNGHTLTAPESGAIYVNPVDEEDGGVFVVKNGTIHSEIAENLYIANCGIQVLDVTMTSVKSQNISYYDYTGKWNKDNLIQNSTIVNHIWYCFSFNSTWENQEKSNITIINSTLAGLRGSGYAPVGLQAKPAGSTGNVVFGEGVKLYTYAKSAAAAALKVYGEPLTLEAATAATVLGETYDMVNVYTSPEKPTMNIADVIPGDSEATTENSPALREVTIVPLEEQQAAAEPEKEAADKDDSAPAEEAGASTGLIIAIVAAVAVIAVVAVVVAKKKKK